MRLACLHVPDFPLAAVLRAEPDLFGSALVVANGAGARAAVIAVSPLAMRRGIAPGCTVAQARAIDDEVNVRACSEDVRRAGQAALADVADAFSPRVEEAEEGTVYLDVDGNTALFPSEGAQATAMVQRALHLGLETQAERDACGARNLSRAKAYHARAYSACQQRVAPALGGELIDAEASWEKLLPLECTGTGYSRDECLARAYEERAKSIDSLHPECAEADPD